MDFSGPNIKKVLMFSQKDVFHIFWEMELSRPKIKKLLEGAFGASEIKKSLKKFLIFQEMELASHKLKKLIFSRNKFFLYFRSVLAKPKNQNVFCISPKKVFPTF